MNKIPRAALFAACLALSAAAPARACELNDTDYASLAQSKSQVTRQNFGKLSEKQKKTLCNTRAFLKKVSSGAKIDCGAIPIWSYRYLTDEEFDRLDKVTTRCIVEELDKKGLAGRGRSS
ncbi:MAG: hypothetical protein HY921_08915 [Elusimicrobia bacterium]|nr:hypothetical protein [Elusimicrobiota bacterium]